MRNKKNIVVVFVIVLALLVAACGGGGEEPSGGGDPHDENYYHLATFSDSGTYSVLNTWGWPPLVGDPEGFDSSVCYPEWPRDRWIDDNDSPVSGSLYLGEAVAGFQDVQTFDINDDGKLIISGRPTGGRNSSQSARHRIGWSTGHRVSGRPAGGRGLSWSTN